MNDAIGWLDQLEKARSRDCTVHTQELVDLVGPPPIPPLRSDMIEHFKVINIISLNADDRRLQVDLRMAEAHSDAEKAEIRAESKFWEMFAIGLTQWRRKLQAARIRFGPSAKWILSAG
jgi:hypothetical protein